MDRAGDELLTRPALPRTSTVAVPCAARSMVENTCRIVAEVPRIPVCSVDDGGGGCSARISTSVSALWRTYTSSSRSKGFWRKSAAPALSAETASGTDAFAARTTTGNPGHCCSTAPMNARPLMSGSARSLTTTSTGSFSRRAKASSALEHAHTTIPLSSRSRPSSALDATSESTTRTVRALPTARLNHTLQRLGCPRQSSALAPRPGRPRWLRAAGPMTRRLQGLEVSSSSSEATASPFRVERNSARSSFCFAVRCSGWRPCRGPRIAAHIVEVDHLGQGRELPRVHVRRRERDPARDRAS